MIKVDWCSIKSPREAMWRVERREGSPEGERPVRELLHESWQLICLSFWRWREEGWEEVADGSICRTQYQVDIGRGGGIKDNTQVSARHGSSEERLRLAPVQICARSALGQGCSRRKGRPREGILRTQEFPDYPLPGSGLLRAG